MNAKLPFLATALCVASAFATAPSYETQREFSASGDFNGDGKTDILIVDKVNGLYRIGTGNGTLGAVLAYANPRPTGADGLTGIAVGKINGTTFDSFAVTGPAQNRLQILSPTNTSYIEPQTFINAGIGPQVMCALDITSGAAPTAEDDIALIVASDPTLGDALREVRSNFGSWSIIDAGDCSGYTTVTQGNPVIPSIGSSPYFGVMRSDGGTDSFHALDPNGAGFTEKFTSPGLPGGSRFIAVPFQVPNIDMFFYVPGNATAHVRRVTPSGPNWVLGADVMNTFPASIEQAVPVADTTGSKVLIRFTNGTVQLYSYILGVGFTAPTTITPTGGAGVLSGVVPMGNTASFQLLYAPAAGQPSTQAITFANNGSGWAQTAIASLPRINVYASYANVLLLSDFPFRQDYVSLIRSYHSGDWSTSASVGGGAPFAVSAQVANYVSATTGIGVSSPQTVGNAGSAPGGNAVNQLNAQFSVFSFDSNLGPAVEDVVISPVAGTYTGSQQITFSGQSVGTNVYYKLGGGSFTLWNPASPPWIFTSGTVQYYADKPGTGPTPSKSATYIITTPPGLQDKDGDGVPDFIEVAKGLDPSGGADSDGDGYTDRDEIAAGVNPGSNASKPVTKAAALGTMTVDASVQLQNTSGTSTGTAVSGTVISLTTPHGDASGSEEVGSGGGAATFARINALNANAQDLFLLAHTPTNFTADPASTNPIRGREMAAVIPLPDEDGWSFGSTQGTFVTTGTSYYWGGTNWASNNVNWNGIEDGSRFDNGWSTSQQSFTFAIDQASTSVTPWLVQFVAAANRSGKPYTQITLSPVTTLEAIIVKEALIELLAERGVTSTSTNPVLLDDVAIVSPRDLRNGDATHPTARRSRIPALLRHINSQLNGSDAGALALRKLARDVYSRHEALIYDEATSTNELGTMTTPIKTLSTWVTTGALPAEYQTCGSMTSTELTNALTKLDSILDNIPTRSPVNLTLYTRSSASPVGLTLVENSSGGVYALWDSSFKPIQLPTDLDLPPHTTLFVTAYNDVPTTGGYTGLEIVSLSVSSLPNTIGTDSDGDLLADEWEMRMFGTLALGTYDSGDGSPFSLGEEYFRETDPRDTTSSPVLPPTKLVFTSFQIVPDGSGTPWLLASWPASYKEFINVDFQASDDLVNWTYPSGFSATDAGGGWFTKAITFDRSKRFFRPVASLKR